MPIVLFNDFFIHCWHNSFASIALLNQSYWGWAVKNPYNYMYSKTPEVNKFKWIYSWFNCYRSDNVFEELKEVISIHFYEHQGNINQLIINSINENKYVFLLCDSYYLKGHRDYGQTHYQNFILIYGYNHVKGLYEVLTDFRVKNQLERFEVSHKAVLLGKLHAEKRRIKIAEFNQNLAIIKKIDQENNIIYQFNLDDIYNNAVKVLETKINGGTCRGIDSIKYLANDLRELVSNPLKSNRLLIEGLASSFLMAYFNQIRNLYLNKLLYEKKYINYDCFTVFNEKYTGLKDNWNIVEALWIKYMLLPQTDILGRVQKRLNLIYEREKEALELFEKSLRVHR